MGNFLPGDFVRRGKRHGTSDAALAGKEKCGG
jgi:hypothetical protein